MATDPELMRQLIRHEGMELRPYRDTVGKLTIGVGRNLDDNGITAEEAMALLRNDLERHGQELVAAFPVVTRLDVARHRVLLNMAFNMGIPALRKFRRMWAAIDAADYPGAAREMLDSTWAEQVGSRATELATIMRTGEWHTHG